MSVYRKWFCTCTGKPIELNYEETLAEDGGEPSASAVARLPHPIRNGR